MLVNCISCHATVIRQSPAGIDIGRSQIGVRCERCHGPARAHAESAEAREKNPSHRLVGMESLGPSKRDRIMEICGGCHRTAANAPAGDPKTENGLARFQGAALARSACFKNSPTLSCVTCHEPHRDVEMNAAKNDSKCISCHNAAGADHKPVCPVDSRQGCVRCHMPAQKIKTIPYALYHNHWIKVWKEKVAADMPAGRSVSDVSAER